MHDHKKGPIRILLFPCIRKKLFGNVIVSLLFVCVISIESLCIEDTSTTEGGIDISSLSMPLHHMMENANVTTNQSVI